MIDINDVLNALVTRTAESELSWSRSANTDEFLAVVGENVITIHRVVTSALTSVESFRLRILDDEDSTVESLESSSAFGHIPTERRATEDQSRQLIQLFLLARRSALDVPTTLAKILDALGES